MRNLDAIINQLANEQQRTEHLLVDDLKAIKQEAQLFFDKQAREADAYLALLSQRFDDVVNRIQNGYPKEEGFRELTEDPVPAFLTKPKHSDSILAAIADAVQPQKAAE